MQLVPTEEHEAAVCSEVQVQSIEEGKSFADVALGDANTLSAEKEEKCPAAQRLLMERASGLDTEFFSLQSKLQVYSAPLWVLVKHIFGSTASTLAQAFLPVGLDAPLGINIQEFQDQVRNYKPGSNVTIPLTWHLPANKTKKTTVAKKLAKLKDYLQVALQSDAGNLAEYGTNDLAIVMQVETERKVKSTGVVEKTCLFRVCPSIYELSDAASSETGELEYTWTPEDDKSTNITPAVSVSDGLPASGAVAPKVPSALSLTRYYLAGANEILDSGDDEGFSTDKGFVDNFAIMTVISFVEILLDIFHLGCFCFTALAPWRMLDLIFHFFRPLQELPYRHALKLLDGIEGAESHLDDYVKKLLPSLNATAKNMQIRRSSLHDRDYNACHGGIYYPGKEKKFTSNRMFNNEFFWGGWSSTQYIEANAHRSTHSTYFKELEKDSLKQYTRRRKAYAKHFDGNTEWFSGMAHYEKERHELQSKFIHLLYFKYFLLGECANVYQAMALAVKKYSDNFTGDNFNADFSDVENIAHAALSGDNVDATNAETVRKLIPVIVNSVNVHLESNRVQLADNMINILKCYQDICNHCHIKKQVQELKVTGVGDSEAAEGDDFLEKPLNESTLTAFSLPILKKSGKKCLTNQPLSTTRAQIRAAARYTIRDLVSSFTLLGLIITLVMATPLVKDLVTLGSFDFRKYRVRSVIEKHMYNFGKTVKRALRTSMWVFLCAVTVVSFLPFLGDLPAHLHSLDDVGNLAKHYTGDALKYFGETILLFLSPRNWYLLVRSTFYVALVPAACAGEIVFSKDGAIGHMWALGIGSTAWFALLFGGLWATYLAMEAGGDPSTSNYNASTKTSVVFVSCMLMFFCITYALVHKRKDYNMPAPSSKTAPSFTHQQALALLTPFVETAQVCAIIVYYFWDTSPFVSTDGITGTVAESGAWAARMFSWGIYSGGEQWYNVSMGFAAGFGCLWVFMLALPATVSGEDEDGGCFPPTDYDELQLTSKERAARIRNSGLYKSLIILMSRVCVVYLMAALLRPLSCIEVTDTDGIVTNVLSTAPDVTCGGTESLASKASVGLLVYMLVTMISVGADDSDDLSSGHSDYNMNADSGIVKFSPLYALEVRICQFFIVAACMGGFDVAADSPMVALGAIIVASVAIALAPLHHTMCCSWRPLVPMRSAGAMSVLWTAVLCILKKEYASKIDNSTATLLLLVGCGVSFLLGVMGYYWTQNKEQSEWMEYLMQNGFADAIKNLEQVSDSLLVQETQMYKTIRSRYETREISKSTSVGTDGTYSNDDSLFKQRHTDFQWRIKNANSLPKLAVLIADIEDKIIFDRLDPAFCAERVSFFYNLVFYEGKSNLWENTHRNSKPVMNQKPDISEEDAINMLSLPRLIFATKLLVQRISENDEKLSVPAVANSGKEMDFITSYVNDFIICSPEKAIMAKAMDDEKGEISKLTLNSIVGSGDVVEEELEEIGAVRFYVRSYGSLYNRESDLYTDYQSILSSEFNKLLGNIFKPIDITTHQSNYDTLGHGLDVNFADWKATYVDRFDLKGGVKTKAQEISTQWVKLKDGSWGEKEESSRSRAESF